MSNSEQVHLKQMKEKLSVEYKNAPGVRGFGLGKDSVIVYVHDEKTKDLFPKNLSVRIDFVKVGEIRVL